MLKKAFDQVEWVFLSQSLEKFGHGSSFVHWVRLLYYNPKASVVTNGRKSPPFQLHRGTREVTLLFALVLEPLAIAIRQNNSIIGIKTGGIQHKSFLYTDNMLLLWRRPPATIPHILTLIGSFSGVWL